MMVTATSATTTPPNIYHNIRNKPYLLFDVDNSLYDDRIFHIERQIIRSI
jgi:hypothetical protein